MPVSTGERVAGLTLVTDGMFSLMPNPDVLVKRILCSRLLLRVPVSGARL